MKKNGSLDSMPICAGFLKETGKEGLNSAVKRAIACT